MPNHATTNHATTNEGRRRQPKLDRARRRAIRAQAAKADVPYSVAARQLDVASVLTRRRASEGRTIYPAGTDAHRQRLVNLRGRRSLADRILDTRRAADVPAGRAGHLADRFPPTRGADRSGVGLLYHGEARQDVLALLYSVIALETPNLVPSVGELAWAAELGEETAVDTACAQLDRAARQLLDLDRRSLGRRVEAVLAAGMVGNDSRVYEQAIHVAGEHRIIVGSSFDSAPVRAGLSFAGARHILDAALVVVDDGHAPGTRVRILTDPGRDHDGTITGANWGTAGPPHRYEVVPDATSLTILADPNDMIVLSDCLQH